MVTQLKEVLAAFSPRADQFVTSLGDGRIKTWDVSSGNACAEFSEISTSKLASEGHLGLKYNCLSWGSLPAKKKKKPTLIAVGTGGGDVLAWDPIVGELKWRTKDCNAGGVNSVSFLKGEESCFCAGADGMVCELSVNSGEVLSKFRASKTPVTSIALSADGSKLLAASGEIRLFDMSTRKRKRKFTGHASSVKTSHFTDDGVYALTAAEGERHVAVWDCEGSEKGAKGVLTMEHPAVAVESWGFGKDGKPLKVLAVSEVGEAYVWSGSSIEELLKASPIRISVGSKKSRNTMQTIIHGRVVGSDSLLVARGVTAKPTFETVDLSEESGKVFLPPSKDGNLLASQPDAEVVRAPKNEVTVLGADNAADATLIKPRVHLDDAKKRKRRSEEETEDEPKPVQGEVDEAAPTPMDEADEEKTMEERLMELGLVDNRSDANTLENAAGVVPPKSDALDLLLTQALRSDDNNILDHCLSVSDEKVIANTIRKINPADACTLLQITVGKLEARPRRGLQLLPWIRAALLEHSTFILSSCSMQPVLTALYQIIDARLYSFRPLLALSGRLELIMAKIRASESAAQNDNSETEVAAVYEEEESDEDVEDALEDDDEDDEEDTEAPAAMEEDKPLENGGSHSEDDVDSDSD